MELEEKRFSERQESMLALFVFTAFLFQMVLIVHFALRKWRFETAIRYGPIVYGLSVPGCAGERGADCWKAALVDGDWGVLVPGLGDFRVCG